MSQLLWKKMETACQLNMPNDVICWCELSLGKLFTNAGDKNIGKVERRVVASEGIPSYTDDIEQETDWVLPQPRQPRSSPQAFTGHT